MPGAFARFLPHGRSPFRLCGATGAWGPCLSGKSPVRVSTACPRQPELIIVVVTVSPLIPRIPLPPARRGLQVNKSSLGAGVSKLTYAPAHGSTGTFARYWGRPWSPQRDPDPEAPTPGCQTTLPSCGSCGAEGRVRAVPWDGSSGRGQAPVCGTAQPRVAGKCRETLWGPGLGSPNKAPRNARRELGSRSCPSVTGTAVTPGPTSMGTRPSPGP